MDALHLGEVRFWCETADTILPVPIELATRLAPVTHCLYEWTPYWLDCPGADRLHVGADWLRPVKDGLFAVRFENELGLTAIQPYADRRPIAPAWHVEVISPKFRKPATHVAFLGALLDDLFARAARLPFAFAAPTGRVVAESWRPPAPIFMLHFFTHCAPALRAALATIRASPHRLLRDHPAMVPIAQVSDVDPDVLLAIVRASHEWVPAPALRLGRRLGGYAPARVWQRLPEESSDTPENRFVLTVLRAFLTSAESLPTQRWWSSVPVDRQATIRGVANLLRQTVVLPLFAEVGPMHHFPTSSRVLLRREGYRDLLALWQLFQRARRPLFAPLQQAMEVRDIATLYEMWAFLALVEDTAVVLNRSPVVELRETDKGALGWLAEARFGDSGRLVYNQTGWSYSQIAMRPDFTWRPRRGSEVAFDAKFRLNHGNLQPEGTAAPEARVKHDDLYRMHAYRDGLNVRAAVVIFPGSVRVGYDRKKGPSPVTLADILLSDWSGVGAIPMRPDAPLGTAE